MERPATLAFSMREDPPGKRIVPLGLGLAMLAVIVAAGLSPGVVATSESAGCAYNQCPAGTSVPWWAIGAIVALVLVGLIAAVLLLRRRRPGGPGPTAAEAGAVAQPPSGATGLPPSGATGQPPSGAAVPPPPYLETPEDVATPPPPLPAPPPAPPAAPPAGAEAEPDIDSLMAELDKISGEILKRAPKRTGTEKTDTEGDEDTPS